MGSSGLGGGSSGAGEERGGLVVRERVRKGRGRRGHWDVRRWGVKPCSIRVEEPRRDIVQLCCGDGEGEGTRS